MKNWIKQNFDTIQTMAIVLGLVFSGSAFLIQTKSLNASNQIASANYVLQISNKLDDSRYTNIINAIENNSSSYSLFSKGFTQNDIEDYIGNFETLGDLARDNLVYPHMAYDELGYDLEKAWCNVDVQQDITQDRKADKILSGASAFYNGFEFLAKYSLNQDHKDCLAMDKE